MGQHAPRQRHFPVRKSFGPQRPPQESLFEDSDPRFGLCPPALQLRELCPLHPLAQFGRLPRAQPVIGAPLGGASAIVRRGKPTVGPHRPHMPPRSLPYLLKASIQQCHRRLVFCPEIVVGDWGYIHQETQKEIRQQWRVAVVPRLKAGMNLVEPFDRWDQASCAEGQRLPWADSGPIDQAHCYVPQQPEELCRWCGQASSCPKEFGYRAELHETLLGLLPLSTTSARRLLPQVRSWIEPTQSYEKHQLGLNQMFLNSLRLVWSLTLLTDAVALLRARALMEQADENLHPLRELLPRQIELGL